MNGSADRRQDQDQTDRQHGGNADNPGRDNEVNLEQSEGGRQRDEQEICVTLDPLSRIPDRALPVDPVTAVTQGNERVIMIKRMDRMDGPRAKDTRAGQKPKGQDSLPMTIPSGSLQAPWGPRR
jgi:hypothetical protein